MLVSTRKLKGNALSYAVAKALDIKVDIGKNKVLWFAGSDIICEFAEDGDQAGEYIEEFKISVTNSDFPWFDCGIGWYGHMVGYNGTISVHGDTMIEAAMRCLVVVQLGDTIEIPNEVK